MIPKIMRGEFLISGTLEGKLDYSISKVLSCANLSVHEQGHLLSDIPSLKDSEISAEFNSLVELSASEQHESARFDLTEETKHLNRYSTVIPCKKHVDTHNMIQLPSVPFLNASYISVRSMKGPRIPSEEKLYIATQGPLEHTVRHFWEMVWQEEVRSIFMLCNTTDIQKGTNQTKCEQYFPVDASQMNTGDFLLTLQSQSQREGIIARNLLLEHVTGERRELSHFLYTGWPDHGIPENEESLVQLAEELLKEEQCSMPVLVHCSAGVGRTGTFLALASAIKIIRAGITELSLFSIVRRMREQRPHMTETIDQYRLVYRILANLILNHT